VEGGDRLGVVARAVELGHAHAAESDGGDLKALLAELAFFHARTIAARAGRSHARSRASGAVLATVAGNAVVRHCTLARVRASMPP
jgi:hypothetical protein